jgi:alpha-1,3-rhamnosyl/mannosyltransferase
VAADRVVVAYPGLTALPDPPVGRIVDRPYFLVVGEQMPRKGLRTLLDAFAAAEVDEAVLVHAGPPSTQTGELRAHTSELRLDGRVTWRGYVSRTELAALFRDAIAFCFPSVDEGFGLPVLEAMACGTPVIASDIPPLREVAGDSALFVSTGDVAAWANALHLVATDAGLRDRLRMRGPERARGFTWDACASATIAAYDRALAAFS